MRKLLLGVGLCLLSQASLAGEADRPEPRPAFCRVVGSPQMVPCARLWRSAYRPVAPVQKPVKARKIVRLPWIIGAFQ